MLTNSDRFDLVQATPSFINKEWGRISELIWSATSEIQSGDYSTIMNGWLGALLAGKAEMWLVMRGKSILAYLITRVMSLRGERILQVDYLVGEEHITEEAWDRCFDRLIGFARAKGCTSIMGETNNMRIVDMVKKKGGDSIVRIVIGV